MRPAGSQRSAPMAAAWRSTSGASNLVPGDTNGAGDVFVHDRQTGTTTRVSVAQRRRAGQRRQLFAGDQRRRPLRHVHSAATNLVAGDTNGTQDVFVHDRQTGTTTRVSVGPGASKAMAPPGPRRAARRSALMVAGWHSRPRPAIWCRATPTAGGTCSCTTGAIQACCRSLQ